MKYSTWLNLWLENYVKPSNKTRTYLRYRQIATNHVEHYLGEQEIDDITPLELQQYVSKLLDCGNIKTGKGLAPNTVNTVISVLQNSLKTAHALGYAKNYAASALKRPRIAEHGVECFSFDEQKKLSSQYKIVKRQRCSAYCYACIQGCASANCLHSNGVILILTKVCLRFHIHATTVRVNWFLIRPKQIIHTD